MTIAVIGGTGFLGNAIARALVAQGASVVQVARGQTTQNPVQGAVFAAADKADFDGVKRVLVDHKVEAVIDVMTLTLATTQPLLDAIVAVGARYVMISAIDVYANYGGVAKLESPAVINRPSVEDDPLRSVLYPYRSLPSRPAGIDPELLKNYDKIPIEEAARANPALKALILRLPAIYGPGDRQQRFTWLTDALQAGDTIRIDERVADWQQSYIYIDDAADAVARATLSGVTSQTFNIATDCVRTVREWAQRFAEVSGQNINIVTCAPQANGLMAERANMSDLSYPLTIDGSRFSAIFGPVQRTDEAAAIRATISYNQDATKAP